MDDAKKFNHTQVAQYLKCHLRSQRDSHLPQDDLASDPESDHDELEDAFPIKKPRDGKKILIVYGYCSI